MSIKELIKQLNEATIAYDKGQPIMSDKDWDDLYFKLVDAERETGIIYPDSPTQTIKYDVVNKLNKVEHNHPMLSLDKTKDIHEVDNFLGYNDYLVMAKLDGLTCSLAYKNGKLVSAETRGNGVIGEDILHNARVIPSIPQSIPYIEDLVVDGEIICFENDFTDFAVQYKNPRNFAAGSIRLLDAQECANRKLSFIAWDMIKGYSEINSFIKRLETLQDLGFEIVPWVQENPTCAVNDIKDYCAHHGYPIDGVVFKFDDVAFGQSLGSTGHHFKNAIAFKFYDEEYYTQLIDIEFGMSRNGQLTPVAIFEPVDTGDSTINKASLHNLSIMVDILGNYPHKGQPIVVAKMNMIIPQVLRAEETEDVNKPIIAVPEKCPVCGEATHILYSETNVAYLFCSNPQCPGKLSNQLDHFFGKKGLDVKGLSMATFDKLVDWGWVNNIVDIFSLKDYALEWAKKPGFGQKSVTKILEAIEAASQDTPLDKFICALGIPLIGTTASKQIAEYFKSWVAFRDAIGDNFDFTVLPDFGFTISNTLLKFDYTQADQLAKIINITYDVPQITSSSDNRLSGKKVVITGKLVTYKNRSELQAAIEQAGGKVVSAVSKNTDILINNDITSNSSKNVTAKKLGIPILSEEQFLAEYLLTD